MTMMNEVNPPLDDVLEHHGVRGMKWGVRKSRGSHPTTQQIGKARVNVRNSSAQIHKQRKKVNQAKTPDAKATQKMKLSEMKTAHLKNPDRVTALHLTKGEATVHALLALGTSGVTLPVLAANEVAARTIARKQRTGAYDKKK